MQGFGGEDFYAVDNASDAVIEAIGGGDDDVRTTVSYTLQAGWEIEDLRFNISTGTDPVTLIGNELVQYIQGNAGNNVLNGKLGNDTLYGLGGDDIFVFDTTLSASNVDVIQDFTVSDDIVHLDDAIFTALAAGPLAAAAFRIGSAAADADDRIVYNSTTGALTYDSNGNAAGGATQFATLGTGLALTNAQFVII